MGEQRVIWYDATKKWPKWGDLIWAHMTKYSETELILVGGFNEKPTMFFHLDEGQWKGLGSEQIDSCDWWCYVTPPEAPHG